MWHRIRAAFRLRAAADNELDEELRDHVERRSDELHREGFSAAEARRRALVELGGVQQTKEEVRAMGSGIWLETLWQDLRYGARSLHHNPGYAAIALLTIALGIGASTAVFSVVYGVVLRPLPYPEPERLVNLWGSFERLGLARAFVVAANYRDWREQNRSFEGLALVRHIGNFNLTGSGEPERVQGARVTASLFHVLRIKPALGRPFREEEEQIGREQVVILSDALWTRRFGRDPGIVGRMIPLNGEPHLVVGVMPRGFAYPSREFELWVPLTVNPEELRTRMGGNFLSLGRLKPGVSIAQAQAEMDTIAACLAQQYPESNEGAGTVLAPMLPDLVGSVRAPLYILMSAVSSLLLIGCASLANLLIARATARSGELMLRSALGAARGRLVRQSLTELAPLLAAGGALGILLAHSMLSLLLPWLPASMPRVEAIAIDANVLLFAVAALAVTTLAAGVWPAWQAGRWNIAAGLRESLRGASASLHGARLRNALVVAQISAAVVLTIAAVLLMRSFAGIKSIDAGFRSEGVATMHLAIPRAKYPRDLQVATVCNQILERVGRLPGARAAGMVNRLPLAGVAQIGSVQIERPADTESTEFVVDWRTATPDYFRALGIPLLVGRGFTEADTVEAPLVGLVDERLAKAAWPNQDPIGQRFRINPSLPWVTVIGVVGHIRHDGLTVDRRPQVYWNYWQRAQDRMVLVVRSDGDPDALARAAIAEIRAVDPEQPVYDVRPMAVVVDRSVAQQWLTTVVLGVFALVALTQACIGVYGVVSYGVARRTREFGIRLALGAQPSALLRSILSHGVRLAAAGVALGILGALAMRRAIQGLLFETAATDPRVFAAVAAVLLVVALLACYVPARRAAKVDPITALRHE
ncbi:MAG: ADOP family duplicated permease [Candidatus Acidiferrales bacterium]